MMMNVCFHLQSLTPFLAFIPFQRIEKGAVLQETRIFNETPLNPRKCCQLLTKVLYLVGQGERFTKSEATDVFFSVTKLFQSKDVSGYKSKNLFSFQRSSY